MDIPSFTEESEPKEQKPDEFDKALDDFEQELDELDEEPFEEQNLEDELPAAEGDADEVVETELESEQSEPQPSESPAEKIVEDLPGLDDIDALTDFDDSELEKALDSYAEEHEELVLEDEPSAEPSAKPKPSEPEDLEDVPGLDDWLVEEGEEEPLDESLLEELEKTSFDELLDNIEDQAEENTTEQDALLDNPDLDLEALLTEDDSLDELDVELAESELEQPEEDFLDVDALLNESIDAESDPVAEKELDLDVSLEQFTGVSGDADTIDVDSDEGLGAKMDLARAYMEIDDTDSAREILEEIAEKGQAEQQAEAKELLKNLK